MTAAGNRIDDSEYRRARAHLEAIWRAHPDKVRDFMFAAVMGESLTVWRVHGTVITHGPSDILRGFLLGYPELMPVEPEEDQS